MGKEQFEKWLERDIQGHFWVLERKVSRAHFENWYVPKVLKKIGASRVTWVQGEEEWEGKQKEFVLPSLFSEREVLFLEDLKEVVALKIAREASRYPMLFFFFLTSGDLKEAEWRKFPWIIVGESQEIFERFLLREAQRFGLSLKKEARELLFRLFQEYELQEAEIMDFLKEFAGGGRIEEKDIEAFFEKSERTLLFRFLDALGEKDTPCALQYAYRLVEGRFPLPLLLTHLTRRFRLLAQLYETEEEQRDLWQEKEVSSFEMKKTQKMKMYFAPSDIPRVFAALRMADRLLKTQSVDPYLWCFLLITEITGPSREPD